MVNDRQIYDVIENAIDSQTAFGELLTSQEKQSLIDYGVVNSGAIGDVLCQQGEDDHRVFIIVMGEVEVSEGSGDKKVVLAHLRRGEVFGEISALFNTPRISTVTITKPSVILELAGDMFEKIISGRSELYDAILDRYQSRLSETALRSVDLFRHKNKESLATLIQASEIVAIPQGGVIVSEGEVGNNFYIIVRGTARVSHLIGDKAINLALIKAGDYFGEWSILTGAPRSATVSAINHVYALRIDRKVILEFIQKNPDITEEIDETAHNRKDYVSSLGMVSSEQQLKLWLENIENVIKQGLEDNE